MRIALFAALAAAVLAALWVGMRPAPTPTPAPDADPVAQTPAAPAVEVPPAPRRFELSDSQGTVPQTLPVLRVQQGEVVEITVTAARDDELHLHGYDLTLDLRGGDPATLAFTAEHAGRFEIELHRGHAGIGVLEVSPR